MFDGQRPRSSIESSDAEELFVHSWMFALHLVVGHAVPDNAWPERCVRTVRSEGSRAQRSTDELPERNELAEGAARRLVVVRCRVVHIGCQPHQVAHAVVAHETQDLGKLEFTTSGRSGIIVCPRLAAKQ